MGMYITGIDTHIDGFSSAKDKIEDMSIKEEPKKYKLVTIDELIEERLDIIISDLNEEARKAFISGKVYFQYTIPKVIWDRKEILDVIAECMDESGWNFDEVENWIENGAKQKIITFRFYKEPSLIEIK